MTADPENRRFLVVADDVWEVEVLQELEQAGIWVLYTTRSVLDFGEAPLYLTQVQEGEAESILRGAAELPADARLPEIAYEIMKRCEYSAMELAFIGRWSPVRLKTSASAWQKAFDLIVNMQSCEGMDERELPWQAAVLRAGLDELALDNISNRELYLSLAVLPQGLAFSTEDAAALLYGKDLLGEDIEAAKMIAAILERWSILTLQEGGKYRVHDSHAEFIQGRITNYPPTRARALKHWQEHLSTADALFAWPSELLADIWRAVARVKGEQGVGFAANQYDHVLVAMESSNAEFPKALRCVATFQYCANLPREAGQTWTTLLALTKDQKGPDHADVAEALYNIGLCHLSAGNSRESANFYQESLAIRDKNGADPQALAYTHYCLGDCAMHEMRVEEAEKWYLLAYEARKGVAAETVLACNLIQIGWCCMHSEPKRLDKAHDIFLEALEVQKKFLSPSHPHIRVTLSRLGRCLLLMDRAHEAELVLREYVLNSEKYLNDDDAYAQQVASAKRMLDECAIIVGRGTF